MGELFYGDFEVHVVRIARGEGIEVRG